MSTGQMTLVLAAFAILSLLVLGVNRILVEKTTVMLDSEAAITSISIAQAMIDEIQKREFDEKAILQRIYTPTNMTALASLGSDVGESVSTPDVSPFSSINHFDDVDDYNGYKRTVSTTRLGGFSVEDSVYYVTASNLDVEASSQTYYKKIVVKVTHSSLKQPIILTDIAVYRRYL